MILVVGATGYLGDATARRLLAGGEAVRAMTRTPEKAEEIKALGAEVVQGDLCDEASLRRACQGVDRVLAAAHSLMGRGQEASKYVDDIGHKCLIDIAKDNDVQHFVYTSVYPILKDGPVPFVNIKYGVEQHLKGSGLSYTILRPTAFMEWHAHNFIGKSILEQGKVRLFGPGENPTNFIAADDVAHFALIALTDQRAVGQTIEIGGPDNKTKMEVVRLYEELSGRQAKVSHVPLAVMRVMSPLLKPFHAGLSQVMAFSIWTETIDATFDPSETLQQYPLQLTGLDDWIENKVKEFTSPTAAIA